MNTSQRAIADPLVPIAIPAQVPVKEGMATLPGARLWYWDTGGDGPPVVFLHPTSGSGLIWEYQQPIFAKAGYRVIAYSRRNHYNSEKAHKDDPGAASEDLQSLIEFLRLSKFHLVGCAGGGSVAADYALSHPDRLLSMTISSNSAGAYTLLLDGEIFEAANTIRPKNWTEIPVEVRELGPSYRAANPEGVKLWLQLNRKAKSPGGAAQRFINAIDSAMLERIRVPTLLLTGCADLATPPSIMRLVARRIPENEMMVVPESGHSIYWERPEIFNSAIADFLDRHAG